MNWRNWQYLHHSFPQSRRGGACNSNIIPSSLFLAMFSHSIHHLVMFLQTSGLFCSFSTCLHHPTCHNGMAKPTNIHTWCLKYRKNCECCPGQYLTVNHKPSMSWFKFRNLLVIVNCVTKGGRQILLSEFFPLRDYPTPHPRTPLAENHFAKKP